MLDVILIQHDRAHEIWIDTTLELMRPLFHSDLVAQMVEAPAGAVQPGDPYPFQSEET